MKRLFCSDRIRTGQGFVLSRIFFTRAGIHLLENAMVASAADALYHIQGIEQRRVAALGLGISDGSCVSPP